MLTIRHAGADDATVLHAWRNDPATRAACRNSDLIAWAEHIRWLEGVLASPKRRIFILEEDCVPVATCRFDYDGPTEFTFCIAPEARAKGFSKSLALFATSQERDFVAYIKQDNIACQRLMAATGARLVKDGEMQLWQWGEP
jgi:hypothetical protein